MNASGTSEFIPGAVGALVDEVPMLTTGHVKPYIIASLLHRGAVKSHEVLAAITPHCCMDDLKVGGWDPLDNDYCEGTRLEKLVDKVLDEFVTQKLVRYNEKQDLWVLIPDNLSTVISWVAALGAPIPQHLLSEMSRQQIARLPEYA
jgi:hypothetical protein